VKRETWASWIRNCQRDPSCPMDNPRLPLAMLTGQDTRALTAIDAAWALYSCSDSDGMRGALAAVRSLLPAMQAQCRPFARELIARHLDWSDRARLWPSVAP
jgi:hypothetical protein